MSRTRRSGLFAFLVALLGLVTVLWRTSSTKHLGSSNTTGTVAMPLSAGDANGPTSLCDTTTTTSTTTTRVSFDRHTDMSSSSNEEFLTGLIVVEDIRGILYGVNIITNSVLWVQPSLGVSRLTPIENVADLHFVYPSNAPASSSATTGRRLAHNNGPALIAYRSICVNQPGEKSECSAESCGDSCTNYYTPPVDQVMMGGTTSTVPPSPPSSSMVRILPDLNGNLFFLDVLKFGPIAAPLAVSIEEIVGQSPFSTSFFPGLFLVGSKGSSIELMSLASGKVQNSLCVAASHNYNGDDIVIDDRPGAATTVSPGGITSSSSTTASGWQCKAAGGVSSSSTTTTMDEGVMDSSRTTTGGTTVAAAATPPLVLQVGRSYWEVKGVSRLTGKEEWRFELVQLGEIKQNRGNTASREALSSVYDPFEKMKRNLEIDNNSIVLNLNDDTHKDDPLHLRSQLLNFTFPNAIFRVYNVSTIRGAATEVAPPSLGSTWFCELTILKEASHEHSFPSALREELFHHMRKCNDKNNKQVTSASSSLCGHAGSVTNELRSSSPSSPTCAIVAQEYHAASADLLQVCRPRGGGSSSITAAAAAAVAPAAPDALIEQTGESSSFAVQVWTDPLRQRHQKKHDEMRQALSRGGESSSVFSSIVIDDVKGGAMPMIMVVEKDRVTLLSPMILLTFIVLSILALVGITIVVVGAPYRVMQVAMKNHLMFARWQQEVIAALTEILHMRQAAAGATTTTSSPGAETIAPEKVSCVRPSRVNSLVIKEDSSIINGARSSTPFGGARLRRRRATLLKKKKASRSLLIGERRRRGTSESGAALVAPPLSSAAAVPGGPLEEKFCGATPLPVSRVPVGSQLSRYLDNGRLAKTFSVCELIGRGAFGAVYKVQHQLEPSHKPYALKMVEVDLRPGDDLSQRRSFREVAANRDLFSKFVVRYYTWWCEEPQFLPIRPETRKTATTTIPIGAAGGYCGGDVNQPFGGGGGGGGDERRNRWIYNNNRGLCRRLGIAAAAATSRDKGSCCNSSSTPSNSLVAIYDRERNECMCKTTSSSNSESRGGGEVIRASRQNDCSVQQQEGNVVDGDIIMCDIPTDMMSIRRRGGAGLLDNQIEGPLRYSLSPSGGDDGDEVDTQAGLPLLWRAQSTFHIKNTMVPFGCQSSCRLAGKRSLSHHDCARRDVASACFFSPISKKLCLADDRTSSLFPRRNSSIGERRVDGLRRWGRSDEVDESSSEEEFDDKGDGNDDPALTFLRKFRSRSELPTRFGEIAVGGYHNLNFFSSSDDDCSSSQGGDNNSSSSSSSSEGAAGPAANIGDAGPLFLPSQTFNNCFTEKTESLIMNKSVSGEIEFLRGGGEEENTQEKETAGLAATADLITPEKLSSQKNHKRCRLRHKRLLVLYHTRVSAGRLRLRRYTSRSQVALRLKISKGGARYQYPENFKRRHTLKLKRLDCLNQQSPMLHDNIPPHNTEKKCSVIILIQMEWCPGVTLRRWLQSSNRDDLPLPLTSQSVKSEKNGEDVPRRLEIALFKQIMRGIRDIHARGIIHRDLKPENIFVDESGSLKIGDFGLARVIEAHGDEITTQLSRKNLHSNKALGASCMSIEGEMIGTPGYTAPEGGAFCTERADIYSAGLILLELLCPRFTTNMERVKTLSHFRKSKQLPNFFSNKNYQGWAVLLRAMGNHDPLQRPPADLILRILRMAHSSSHFYHENGTFSICPVRTNLLLCGIKS